MAASLNIIWNNKERMTFTCSIIIYSNCLLLPFFTISHVQWTSTNWKGHIVSKDVCLWLMYKHLSSHCIPKACFQAKKRLMDFNWFELIFCLISLIAINEPNVHVLKNRYIPRSVDLIYSLITLILFTFAHLLSFMDANLFLHYEHFKEKPVSK